MLDMRTTVVKQLPEALTPRQARALLHEMKAGMSASRPRMVLDCAQVRRLDRVVVHLMLCCLEEAMKRNGDVSLAAVPRGAERLLEAAGVTRLFDIYETAAEAENEYRRVPPIRSQRDISYPAAPRPELNAAGLVSPC